MPLIKGWYTLSVKYHIVNILGFAGLNIQVVDGHSEKANIEYIKQICVSKQLYKLEKQGNGQILSHDPQFENPSTYLASVSSSFLSIVFSETQVFIQIMKKAVPAMVYFLSIYCVPNTVNRYEQQSKYDSFLPLRIFEGNRKWLIYSAAKWLDNIYFIELLWDRNKALSSSAGTVPATGEKWLLNFLFAMKKTIKSGKFYKETVSRHWKTASTELCILG